MSTSTNRLYRSRDDKKIAGVCGGLADYFGIDATVIRLVFVILFLIGMGSPALVYIVLWIVMRKEPVMN